MTKLSVVLPVYNRLHLIGNALYSLGRQTYLPHEIIVVDDGSTDGPLQAEVEQFAHLLPCPVFYIRLERSPKYLNSSHAYNVGIKAAAGDAVVYCASELIHFPHNLELLAAALNENPDAFVIGGSIYFQAEHLPLPPGIESNPELIKRLPHDRWHEGYHANDFTNVLMWDSNSGVHAVGRRHLLEVGGFEESLTSWGHNDGHMRRRMTELKGLPLVRRPEVQTIHPWHPRPPADNMAQSTPQRLQAEGSGLIANVGRDWGVVYATPAE